MLPSSEIHIDLQALIVSTLEVGVRGLSFERSLKPEALNALLLEPGNDFGWSTSANSLVSCSLEQENAHAYRVHIKSSLTLNCACVRCLEIVPHALELDFVIRMLEKEAHKEEEFPEELCFDGDSALNGDEALVGYFSARSIDLGQILREQIFLEVPDYPKCGGDRALIKKACSTLIDQNGESHRRENPFIKLFNKKS
jgi:uncharacterized metal-binding protein YceD (DUF177 family)